MEVHSGKLQSFSLVSHHYCFICLLLSHKHKQHVCRKGEWPFYISLDCFNPDGVLVCVLMNYSGVLGCRFLEFTDLSDCV